jgi:hypothetical protein
MKTTKWKAILVVLLPVAASLAAAQVKLNVTLEGRPMGTANLSQKLLADGSKQVEVKMTMESGGRGVELRTFSSYDSKGVPTRKFHEMRLPGTKTRRQVTVTFDGNGANVVIEEDAERSTRHVSLVEKAPRENLSEFWFLRDKPKPGQAMRIYSFDMDKLAWELLTVTYVGKKSITVGGRKVDAHEIASERGTAKVSAFVDDAGFPLLLQEGRMRMERVFD